MPPHENDTCGLSTRAVHGGAEAHADEATGALETPIVLSSAFALGSPERAAAAFRGETDAWIYGRWGNPTVRHLEERVAVLEGAEAAVATASGMAAISGTLLALARAGEHVVAPRSMYGEAARLLRERLPRLGVETTFIDDTSAAGYEREIRPSTRVLYIETPANPMLAITDIAEIVALARARGLHTVADNTFATPFCQTPLALGVDAVVHSMTKSLGGHGDAIAGCMAGSRALVAQVADVVVKGFGGAIAPLNAYLVARGIATFALRQRQATSTALAIARWLASRRGVARVHHPGLASHPGHAVAARQMRAFGSLVAFEVEGGHAPARRVVERVRLVTHAVSLGDVRSLITHPASTTASTMPVSDRARAGIGDGLLRLSVGIEDEADLIADLDRALG